jgi:cytidyltransferase-like protein
MRIGYTSGVFDLFHFGHANYLTECKRLCDYLIVAVDSDTRVKKIKGIQRPIETEFIRLGNVSTLSDKCFIKKKASIEYIRRHNPDFIFIPDNKNYAINSLISAKVISIPYTHSISTTMVINNLNNLPNNSY